MTTHNGRTEPAHAPAPLPTSAPAAPRATAASAPLTVLHALAAARVPGSDRGTAGADAITRQPR